MKKRYSDEEILLQLKNYYKKNEKITQYGFSKDKTVCEPYAVIIRFGSWEEGLKRAGIKYRVRELSVEEKKEEIRKQVKAYIIKTGQLPSSPLYKSYNKLPSRMTVDKYFGSKEKLYIELGYIGKTYGELLSKKEIIEKIREFYKKEGREPRQEDFRVKNDLPTYKNIKKYFSGITEAKILAGFKVADQYRIYTREEAINELQTFYEREERYPLKGDMKAKNGLPPIRKLKALFGTVRAAREAAGLTKGIGKNKTYIDKEKLEELLLEKYKEKGRRLTSREIREDKELVTLGTIYSTLRKQTLKEAWEYMEKKYKLVNK